MKNKQKKPFKYFEEERLNFEGKKNHNPKIKDRIVTFFKNSSILLSVQTGPEANFRSGEDARTDLLRQRKLKLCTQILNI